MNKFMLAVAGLALLAVAQPSGGAQKTDPKLARAIMDELVAVNTAPSGGNDTSKAVSLLVRRLKAAGFEDAQISVLGQTEALQNLVVQYPSSNPARRPLLLMAHLDVVEALPDEWTYEPFAVTEEEGWLYGRGTNDNKAGAAILIANLIRLRNEGFEPDRDLIVMLTADEETTGNATKWLLAEHRDLIDAEFALNTDGGPILLIDGKPLALMLQTGEKIYASFALQATDPGGHSSRPHRDSAISRLSRALVDLEAYEFPIDLNETTRAFFERWISVTPEDEALIRAVLADNPEAEALDALLDEHYYNAIARTTCVATQLEAGHAENALPQTARAVVNCRYLPQSDIATVTNTLQQIAADYEVSVTQIDPSTPSPPSPLAPPIVKPITEIAQSMWQGIVVIPEMSTGATDGAFVRNAGIPVYTVSAIADDPNDMRAHGQDERISVQAFNDSNHYWYRLIKSFATPAVGGN
jgi:acetylornithine deacetylase/succinyl-diaminopimelate desuccinylase-like protein